MIRVYNSGTALNGIYMCNQDAHGSVINIGALPNLITSWIKGTRSSGLTVHWSDGSAAQQGGSSLWIVVRLLKV